PPPSSISTLSLHDALPILSSLALVLHEQGLNVQGSDIEKYFFTQRDLEKANITILPFNAENVKPGMTIIAGNAFPDSHEEIQRADRKSTRLNSSHVSISYA